MTGNTFEKSATKPVVNKVELEGILIFKDNPIQADHVNFFIPNEQ